MVLSPFHVSFFTFPVNDSSTGGENPSPQRDFFQNTSVRAHGGRAHGRCVYRRYPCGRSATGRASAFRRDHGAAHFRRGELRLAFDVRGRRPAAPGGCPGPARAASRAGAGAGRRGGASRPRSRRRRRRSCPPLSASWGSEPPAQPSANTGAHALRRGLCRADRRGFGFERVLLRPRPCRAPWPALPAHRAGRPLPSQLPCASGRSRPFWAARPAVSAPVRGRFFAVFLAFLITEPTMAMRAITTIRASSKRVPPFYGCGGRGRRPPRGRHAVYFLPPFCSSSGLATVASVPAMESRMRVSEMTFCML